MDQVLTWLTLGNCLQGTNTPDTQLAATAAIPTSVNSVALVTQLGLREISFAIKRF